MEKKNKRGWIRIIEALVTILLISGFLIVLLDSQKSEEADVSFKIYKTENAILREIQLNYTYRDYILGIGETVVEFENFDTGLKNHINSRIPEHLNCTSKICDFSTDSACEINSLEKDIYVKAVMIAADVNTYNPKLLKIFCWTA